MDFYLFNIKIHIFLGSAKKCNSFYVELTAFVGLGLFVEYFNHSSITRLLAHRGVVGGRIDKQTGGLLRE